MKIYLRPSWVLTDEQYPMAAKGTPVLIDLETWKIYHPGDRIEGVLAQQVISLAVEEGGEIFSCLKRCNSFLGLKKETMKINQSVRATWVV